MDFGRRLPQISHHIHDKKVAAQLTAATKGWRGFAPKKMFDGTAWMLNGNMCPGIWNDSVVVPCGPPD